MTTRSCDSTTVPQSQSFLKDDHTEEEYRDSSDDDSTLIGRPQRKRIALHLNPKTVIYLLISLGLLLTLITALLIWLLSLHSPHQIMHTQEATAIKRDDGTTHILAAGAIQSNPHRKDVNRSSSSER